MKNYIIRRETEKDYRAVENLTREAFWNVYRPGCYEHYVLHHFRDNEDYVPELSTVIELDGRIIAHIMYSRAKIACDDGSRLPIMVFGPVSVHPDFQKMGYGCLLIRHTLAEAKRMGCGAVAITGSPVYYARFGFEDARGKGIYYSGLDRNTPTPFFMVLELEKGYLSGISGTYADPQGYNVNPEEVERFDVLFSPKVKMRLPGQLQ